MHKAIKRQRTIVGKLLRALQRRQDVVSAQAEMLSRIEKLLVQGRKDKNKIYALHAPEVECLSKGKARQPYEFGVTVKITKIGTIIYARLITDMKYEQYRVDVVFFMLGGVGLPPWQLRLLWRSLPSRVW